MKTSKFTEEQIAMALRQVEAGTPVGEICRKLQVTEQTFYRWKKKYGSLGTPEIRELRQLRDENRKLKQLVADLTLDKHILQESLKKSTETTGAPPVGRLGPGCIPDFDTAGLSGQWLQPFDDRVPVASTWPGASQEADDGAGCGADQLRISASSCPAPT